MVSYMVLSPKYLLTAFFWWPILFSITTFTLFFSLHSHKQYIISGVRQIPTISLTGGYLPESMILTAGLHMQAFLLFILLQFIYHRYKVKNVSCNVRDVYFESVLKYRHGVRGFFISCLLSSSPLSIDTWNVIGYRVGICTCLFLFLTGTVSVEEYSFVHGTFAALMFLSAIVLMIIYHLKVCRPFMNCNTPCCGCLCLTTTINNNIDVDSRLVESSRSSEFSTTVNPSVQLESKVSSHPPSTPVVKASHTVTVTDPNSRMRLLQSAAFIILIPFSLFMFLIAAITSFTCASYSCVNFVVDISPALEYTTVFSFLLFMESFRDELHDEKLEVVEDCSIVQHANMDNNV